VTPLGAIEITVALVSAGAALLGALVGGAGSYFVERRLRLKEIEAQARAGARLVIVDLDHCQQTAGEVASDAEWWPFFQLPIGAWERYREPLALQLETDVWNEVATTINVVRYMAEGIERRPPTGDPRAPTRITETDAWANLQTDINTAIEALRPLT
jgi:hypothetical protein